MGNGHKFIWRYQNTSLWISGPNKVVFDGGCKRLWSSLEPPFRCLDFTNLTPNQGFSKWTQGIGSKTWVISLSKKKLSVGIELLSSSANITSFKSAKGVSVSLKDQDPSLVLIPKLATRLCHLHCHIALECPIYWYYQYWVRIFISQSHISYRYRYTSDPRDTWVR